MRKQYPVSIACEVLEVSASGYFTWQHHNKANRGTPPGRYSDEALLVYMRAIRAKVHRHRLNHGADRQANNALWTIALVRMRGDAHP